MHVQKKKKYRLYLIVFNILLLQNLSAQFKDIQIDYFGQQPPGRKAVVFSPDFICTPGSFIQNCCFSTDGKEFIYTTTNKDWSASTIMYTRYENGEWAAPVPLPTIANAGSVPCFSYDGNDIYLIMYGYNNTASADIYVCHRTKDGWSDPENLGSPVNSVGNEWEVCISKNNTLYFSSDRAGGFGDLDMCTAELVDGKFTNFRNLGMPINTNSKDECPYIAPDESFMVFNDWKTNPRFQGNNLYITYKKPDGSWTNPKDLGYNINTNKLDIYPFITPDGKYLMYTIRDGAYPAVSSKLYWAGTEFIDSLRYTNYEPYCKNRIPLLEAVAGTPFIYQLPDSIFYDDDITDTLTYSVRNMPSWLNFNSETKTFSGTPTAKATTKIFTITAADQAKSKAETGISIVVKEATDVDKNSSSINEFKLNQNYPNPFNPITVIGYQLPASLAKGIHSENPSQGGTLISVKLKVYDALGHETAILVDKEQNSGKYEVNFNCKDYSSGVYFVRLQAGNYVETKKMLLVK